MAHGTFNFTTLVGSDEYPTRSQINVSYYSATDALVISNESETIPMMIDEAGTMARILLTICERRGIAIPDEF